MDRGALGLIETKGLVAAIEAADAATKAASVRLLGLQKTNPALITVQIVGETAAVRSAIDAAKAAAERVGSVVSTHVIPRPAIDVARMQSIETAGGSRSKKAASSPATKPAKAKSAPKPKAAKPQAPKPATRPSTLAAPPAKAKVAGSLATMTVRELRALARSKEGLSIQGREIARASKAELLRALGR